MAGNTRESWVDVMPFRTLTNYELYLEHISSRKILFEQLDNNGFSDFFKILREDCPEKINPSTKSQYMDTDQVNDILMKGNHNLSVFHLNIRRLAPNKGKLLAFLSLINDSFDIIILTEIGDNADHFMTNELFPDHENAVFDLPKHNKYGGTAIFIRKNIGKLTTRQDLQLHKHCECDKCNFESTWVELETQHNTYLIGGVYRHPNGKVEHFTSSLENTLDKLDPKAVCIIAGDTNIDLIKIHREDTFQYFTLLTSYNFLPHIVTPTRITDNTATLIDHVFIRQPSKQIETHIIAGNIISDVSDHLPNVIFIENKRKKPNTKKERSFIRIFSGKNLEKFKSGLSNSDWHTILSDDDADAACNNFYTHILEIYNQSFPLTRISRKRSKDKKWFTAAIKKSSQNKNILYKKKIQNPTAENIEKYKKYLNLYNSIIRSAEQKYYLDMFQDKKQGIRNFWKTAGLTLNPNKRKDKNRIQKLLINGEGIFDDQGIANSMNNHFCEVGQNISNKIPKTQGHFRNYLKNKINETFFLQPIIEHNVRKIIKSLDAKKSAGPDNLKPKLIKVCSEQLTLPLTILFNKSIATATYPSEFKLAKIIALYKKKSRYVPTNYRPISLLNCFNKIFERLIQTQMLTFIEKHKILYINQYGFRKGFSTTLALIDVVDFIKRCIDNKEYVLGIFLDLEKAFDSIDHDILLAKLDHYGFRGHSNKFLKSYLKNRQQYTFVNKKTSSLLNVKYGVPQGSILGPLLFLLYINDISQVLEKGKGTLFADDTAITFRNRDINQLINQAEGTLKDVKTWFNLNNLSLSIGKSSCVLFHGIKQDPKLNFQGLKVGREVIPRTKCVKYIGLHLDELLNFDYHVNELCKSLTKYFGVFYHMKHTINNKIARTIYYTCLHSRIKYGIEIYGTTSDKNMKKIQTLQNKLLRLLLNKNPLYSTDQLHAEMKILKIVDVHKHCTLQFVYKCTTGDQIIKFRDYFTARNEIHSYNTRYNHHLNIPDIPHTELVRSTTHYNGTTLWNELDENIKDSENLNIFKKRVYNSLARNYTT